MEVVGLEVVSMKGVGLKVLGVGVAVGGGGEDGLYRRGRLWRELTRW